MIQALICMTIYLYLLPRVPLSKFSSPEYQKWGLVDRLGFMYISGFTARWKYYFIWSISQVAMIISGLGFSGWSTTASSSEPTPDWTRAKNVDIVKVELAKSGVELPMYWNISVSTWLRHCILLLCVSVLPGFFCYIVDSQFLVGGGLKSQYHTASVFNTAL
jgi:lysophospholipid acyltransferase